MIAVDKYEISLTEAEWQGCIDLLHMWVSLARVPAPRDFRKYRLFNCACVRRVLDCVTNVHSQRALHVLERNIEGAASWEEVEATRRIVQEAALDDPAAWLNSDEPILVALKAAGARAEHSSDDHGARAKEEVEQCHLFRDIFSNPFRPATLDPSWLTSTVVALARGIYEERAFDRMPILADALQDAGCDNEDVLNHCRGPGPHVRGCWVVDLVLGKT